MRTLHLLKTPDILCANDTRTFASYTLNAEQQKSAAAWLANHPAYRLAEDRGCNCDEEIRGIRTGYGGSETPVPDYHPYIASGDFNGDSVIDFAVVVVNRQSPRDFTLLVFNGPLRSKRPLPAFIESHIDMTAAGLFYGPPSGSPNRLLIGPFESEGQVLEPHGKTYRLR